MGKMAQLSHILACRVFQSDSRSLPLSARPDRVWYNWTMTEAFQEAVSAIQELPDDVQDSIAYRLMQLMELGSMDEE